LEHLSGHGVGICLKTSHNKKEGAMKKKITIITIVLAMNLFILACLNGGYGWENYSDYGPGGGSP
jgi:cell division protein FtsB